MKNREIRIIPMSEEEFENKTIVQIQQDYFVNDLPNRPQCEYNYRASGLSSCDGSLVLFQYKNRIVASAIFKESVKYKEPLEGIYKGYLSFYKDTIQILNPISSEELKKFDNNFEKFSNVKQYLKCAFESISELIQEKRLDTKRIIPVMDNDSTDIILLKGEYEVSVDDDLNEGKMITVKVNRYERSRKAREICLDHYGYKCMVCGFDFEKVYGEVGKGIIEVHHKKALNEIKENYNVDPINDLVPLCSNCHTVIHSKKTNLTIEELRDVIKIRE